MKLPSIQQSIQECQRTFKRFPTAMAVALLGTLAALILVDRTGPDEPSVLFRILFAAALGFPFLAGLILAAEKRGWRRSAVWGAQGAGLLVVFAYAITVPTSPFQGPEMHLNRFSLLLVAALMLMAVAPFLRKGELNGFWQYNKTLFFRLLTVALYSAVLFAGLAIALAALDQLFGVDIPGRRYFQLWISIVGFFSTGFFLSGVPANLSRLDQETEYPRSLKVFSQYILLPLVLLYMIILYAYIGKIVAQWNWPKGWVSALILGFTATGISAFLLVYPIRDLAENSWIRRAWRWFYLIIIPLILVLFLAASQRISQYGITEGRYILLTCGVWLTLLALYFNLSKTRSIKFIPLSVGLITLIISFGPWGAFTVSERSQIHRLETLFTRNEILANGKVQKAPSSVPHEDSRDISSILQYLQKNHGYDAIQPWFSQNLRPDSLGAMSPYLQPSDVAKLMGVEYVATYAFGNSRWYNYAVEPDQAISTIGYQYLLREQALKHQHSTTISAEQVIDYSANETLDTLAFVLIENGARVDSVQLNPRRLVTDIRRTHQDGGRTMLPPESLSISAVSEGLSVMVLLNTVHGGLENDSIKTMDCTADILMSISRPKK
jgi:hypothetical protein